MASHRPPRRTRVYDVNYNIGQSLYKPALDKLDRKYSAGPDLSTSDFPSVTPTLRQTPPRTRFNLDDAIDEDLKTARSRANRAITEESVFDGRGTRALRGFQHTLGLENEIDDDVQASLSRIRANKPKMSSLINELDLDDPINSIKSHVKKGFGDKFLENGDDFSGSSAAFRSRAVKLVSRTEDSAQPSFTSSFRHKINSAITDASESVTSSAASLRAKATKARLADIETDLFQRSEKQLAREKRASHLKKILAENDIEPVKSLKKVTF